MIFDFKDKNVLITGGSRGIGKACAQMFAQAGANVIITYKADRDTALNTLAQLPHAQHSVWQLDVGNSVAIEGFFKQIAMEYTHLDVLVNNAGVYVEHKIDAVSYEQWHQRWDETLRANLTGPANMCYWASRMMMQQGKGKIINVSSRGAFRGEPDHPAYGASKAALNAMSQSLAVALAPYHISVHVIAPGFVETDMAADVLASPEGESIRKQSPFGRVAQPVEVARLVAIYASEGLEFTSGGIADINGASYLRG